MYYQSYEDYIRNILGYSNTYNNSSIVYDYPITSMPKYSNEILDLYPDIYKIVNPMVCKICEANTKPITRELIEQMADEIYLNLESDMESNDEVINVRVNLPKSTETTGNSVNAQKNVQNISNNNSKRIRDNRQESKQENRQETANKNRVEDVAKDNLEINNSRQIRRRNNTLRDLIKILILNQLLGGRRPQRPPRPNPPPRPPYPGGFYESNISKW